MFYARGFYGSRESVATAQDCNDLCETFKQASKGFGISEVAYLRLDLPDNPEIASTCPQLWKEIYAEHKLHEADPALHVARQSVLPGMWDAENAGQAHQDYFGFAKACGMPLRGAAVGLRNPQGGVAVFSVASHTEASEWKSLFNKYLVDIQMMALVFHDAAHQLLSKLGARLSPREREVLTWAARGKTAWETGAILGLTEGTVNQYLRSAIVKLDASSKLHCVVLALQYNLIEL